MPSGQNLVVGAGDGGVVPGDAYPPEVKQRTETNQSMGAAPGGGVVGYGNAVPPGAISGLGEPLGGSGALQGQDAPYKS